MLAGETASYNGHEYCLFPLPYMRCTQRGIPGDMSLYSHCCTYACDWGQPDPQTIVPVYAPFTGHLVNSGAANGRCYFVSDNSVWTPGGLAFVTLELVHDNNPPASGAYAQGSLIYHTGTAGNVTGAHVHIDQSNRADERIHNSGYACPGSSTGACWTLPHTRPEDSIFYITGNETIVNLRGLQFPTVPVTPTPVYTGNVAILLLAKLLKRRKEQNARRDTSSIRL